jgi:predicted nucleotidyltransferase
MVSTVHSFPTLAEIKDTVRAVCLRHPVARMDLFGSAVNGRAKVDSDVDLLVEFLPEARIGLLEMGTLREDLADALGRSVDLVSRQAIERSANPFRRKVILGTTVNVYAR